MKLDGRTNSISNPSSYSLNSNLVKKRLKIRFSSFHQKFVLNGRRIILNFSLNQRCTKLLIFNIVSFSPFLRVLEDEKSNYIPGQGHRALLPNCHSTTSLVAYISTVAHMVNTMTISTDVFTKLRGNG